MNRLLALIAIYLIFFLIMTMMIIIGWNLFMVPVFALKSLTLTQALGFTLLSSIFKPVSFKTK